MPYSVASYRYKNAIELGEARVAADPDVIEDFALRMRKKRPARKISSLNARLQQLQNGGAGGEGGASFLDRNSYKSRDKI